MKDNEKRLLLRQIKDVQNQADKLINNPCSEQDIIHFSNFSNMLKSIIKYNIDNDLVLRLNSEIPDVSFSNSSTNDGFLNILLKFLPIRTNGFGIGSQGKDNARNNIRQIQGKFAHIEMILKNIL